MRIIQIPLWRQRGLSLYTHDTRLIEQKLVTAGFVTLSPIGIMIATLPIRQQFCL
jgi:hypothetical protein